MIAYASRTGTITTLDALCYAGWRLLVSAAGTHCAEGFQYAIDNGAWTAHTQKRPFNTSAFMRVVARLGADADFIVVPDIVAGGLASLRLSMDWLPQLDGVGRRRLLAVQDGMTAADIAPMLCDQVGVFVGGTTPWKERTMAYWGDVARSRNAYMHVGRVNSARRILLCHDAGADSFDGTSVPQFPSTLPLLDRALKNPKQFRGRTC
jgi:hypothetical protein